MLRKIILREGLSGHSFCPDAYRTTKIHRFGTITLTSITISLTISHIIIR